MTDTAVKTPLSDMVAKVLDAMRSGGSMIVMDIPGDSSYSASKFGGEVSKEIARRADLAAVPAQGWVKPLVWSSVQEPNEACRYHHVTSESSLGKYRIEWKGWKQYDSMVIYCDERFLDTEGTLEAAKAAAQADYAALEPQPDPRDEVIARLVEAVDECRQALKDYMNQYPHMVRGYLVDAEQHARAALAAAKAVQHG